MMSKTTGTYYKPQLPAGYDMNYRYEDVRYSNWTKIPVVMPSIKKILDLTIGKTEADTISLRTYFLRKYNICLLRKPGHLLYLFSLLPS